MKILILILTLVPSFGFADMLVCRFNEPFITVNWYADDGVVTYLDAEGRNFSDQSRVTFRRNIIDVRYGESDLVLSVDTSKPGSDGMSDQIYLYEGRLNVHGGIVGGCEPAVFERDPDKQKPN